MKACSKCGAENPASAKYCVRCEMPLPNSGAGETLAGGPSGSHGASPGGLLRQETLFGISPEQMAGGAAPEPPPVVRSPPAAAGQRSTAAAPPPAPAAHTPAPVAKPPGPASGAQTFFGVAPPGVYP